MKKTAAAALFLAAIISGAFAAQGAEGARIFSHDVYTFELPQAWQKSKYQPKATRHNKEKIMVVTKDGVSLESIEFGTKKIDSPFRNTKKKLTAGMMPLDTAEIVLNDFELNETMKNLHVYEKKPATVSGIHAFRLVFSYRDEGKLLYKCVYYGFQKGDMFHSIRYVAPLRHYYDAYLATFEQVVKSVKINGQSDRSPLDPP